jgi:hypothetical protein
LAYVSDRRLRQNDWRNVVIFFHWLVLDLGLPWRIQCPDAVVGDAVPRWHHGWLYNRILDGCRLRCIDVLYLRRLHGGRLRCIDVHRDTACDASVQSLSGSEDDSMDSDPSPIAPAPSADQGQALPPLSLHFTVASPWLQHAAAPQRHRVCFRPHTDQNLFGGSPAACHQHLIRFLRFSM